MAHSDDQRKYNKKKKLEIVSWLNNEIKPKLTCERCPQNHPATLDFHHIDPATKIAEVRIIAKQSRSKEKVLQEIAKCIVLCANCHRIHHYNERSGVI